MYRECRSQKGRGIMDAEQVKLLLGIADSNRERKNIV